MGSWVEVKKTETLTRFVKYDFRLEISQSEGIATAILAGKPEEPIDTISTSMEEGVKYRARAVGDFFGKYGGSYGNIPVDEATSYIIKGGSYNETSRRNAPGGTVNFNLVLSIEKYVVDAPSSITVPSTIKGGESITISWGSSPDATRYYLERKIDNGSWVQIYQGTNLSYKDSISKSWNRVTYRVKAYSSSDGYSSYRTSPIRTVINNTAPIITDNTINNKTLYEGNVLTLTGNLLDSDNGDVISVKYNINGGTTRAIASGISDGKTPLPYNKSLLFKEGKLYDGATAVSNQLSDNTKHLIKIWGEDDKGGKAEVKEIFFYVVNNRPATLTINPITEQNDLIDTDTILITGNVTDPDGNETTINYKTNSGSFITLNSGQDRDFEIRIPVSSLIDGNNNITIQAKDSYGAITEKVVKLNKEKKVQPLKTAVREYKMIPPDGTAKGILLWIQREVGDLTTKVEIKFGNKPYQELSVNHTGLVTTGLEEDEYVYENDTEESEIYLRITMNRTSTTSNKGIKLISGVFN